MKYAADFHDITTGNNGFAAGPGYNLVTGIGSPIANNLVPDLLKDVTTTSVSSSADPSVFGQPVSFTATVSANGPSRGKSGVSSSFLPEKANRHRITSSPDYV